MKIAKPESLDIFLKQNKKQAIRNGQNGTEQDNEALAWVPQV